ncbi:MAG: hypothetical protein [Caudoviricetes sp.]|nr:MAG: hypothetical protein [Caudoviricetes sp.]
MKASELKVGMETELGDVESIFAISDTELDICFSVHDYDCGETEYYPMVLSFDEEVRV